jgi:hypothetical protein
MSDAFRGTAGSGSVLVYLTPRDHMLRLELLTFTLTTDGTAGVHAPVVILTDSSINQVTARIWDWNEAGPSMTLYYTFGIGLRPFNCTVTTGMMIPNNLPDTILAPETQITVASVNAAGATITGDAISAVTLYGELIDSTTDTIPHTVDLIDGLLPGLVLG